MNSIQCTCANEAEYLSCPIHADNIQQAMIEIERNKTWRMIRPISQIKQEIFPQRVQVHHATTSYGGSVEKERD
jgi:hypothetical protein